MSSLFARAIAAIRLFLGQLIGREPLGHPAHGWLLPVPVREKRR
jgi:hypothetical protein